MFVCVHMSRADFVVGFVTPQGIHIGAGCAWRTAPCGKVSHFTAFSGDLLPGLILEKEVHGELSPWERLHGGVREGLLYLSISRNNM